jgi:hypothetical protein
MIVVATPRSGATNFCFELAKKYNKPFYGEISSTYIKGSGLDNYKQRAHEIVNSQPDYDDSTFTQMLEGSLDGIFLVNKTQYLYAPNAHYILLREPIDVLMSMADGLKKAYPGFSVELICQYLAVVFEDMYGLITYCLTAKRNVIWFENYYKVTTNTLIEYLSLEEARAIRVFSKKLIKRSDILDKIVLLKNNS